MNDNDQMLIHVNHRVTDFNARPPSYQVGLNDQILMFAKRHDTLFITHAKASADADSPAAAPPVADLVPERCRGRGDSAAGRR